MARLPRDRTMDGSPAWPLTAASVPTCDSAVSSDTAAPLTVLHLFKFFRPDFTGEGLYVERLAPALAALGIRSDVAVSFTAPPAVPPRATAIGRIRHFGRRDRRTRRFGPRLLLWLLANAWRYDVVHVHSPVDRYFLPHLIVRAFGCRIVQSCTLEDGIGQVIDSYRPRVRPLVRLLCRRIGRVVAISPRLHEDSLRVMPPSRVALIPQGVAIPSLSALSRAAARARFGYADEETVLLFVGGLCARKDVRFLIDNHLSLLGECRALRLLIAGPDLEDEYAAELRAMVADAVCSGRIAPGTIRFAGHLENPSEAYRAADLFVFASRAEGFGNVLLEAMAYALPVVARRLPGVTDSFVTQDVTGDLFDDAAGYSRAVLRLAADPALRARRGAAGREAAAKGFSLPEIAARYAALYRALARPRAR
jgi:glycosyltransferase involved in cell wall biosynthesis